MLFPSSALISLGSCDAKLELSLGKKEQDPLLVRSQELCGLQSWIASAPNTHTQVMQRIAEAINIRLTAAPSPHPPLAAGDGHHTEEPKMALESTRQSAVSCYIKQAGREPFAQGMVPH